MFVWEILIVLIKVYIICFYAYLIQKLLLRINHFLYCRIRLSIRFGLTELENLNWKRFIILKFWKGKIIFNSSFINFKSISYSYSLIFTILINCKFETVTILDFSCVSMPAALQLLFYTLIVRKITSERCTTTMICNESNYK